MTLTISTCRKDINDDRRGKVIREQEVFTHSNGKIYNRVTTNTYDTAERLISSTLVCAR